MDLQKSVIMNIEEIKDYSLSNNVEKLIPYLKENGLISSNILLVFTSLSGRH